MVRKTTLFAIVAALLASTTAWSIGIREVANPAISDAAIASYDAYGPVIYYNPVAMNRLGAAGRFVRAHEYAHHHLDHVRRSATGTGWLRKSMELEADCMAAQTLAAEGDWIAIQAAAEQFARQGPYQGSPLHPPGIVRARQIIQCAG